MWQRDLDFLDITKMSPSYFHKQLMKKYKF